MSARLPLAAADQPGGRRPAAAAPLHEHARQPADHWGWRVGREPAIRPLAILQLPAVIGQPGRARRQPAKWSPPRRTATQSQELGRLAWKHFFLFCLVLRLRYWLA